MPVPIQYLKIKCLVVDDEPSMRKTVSNMLGKLGFTSVITAENGKRAMDIIKISPVDLVIADINMPEMTGVELFKTVREDKNYDNMVFIFVTAEATRQTVARAAEEGGEGYIIKPFVMGILEDKIAKALEKKFKPGSVESCLNDFSAAMAKKDFQRAEDALGKAAALVPDAAKVIHNFGLLYLARGDVKRAIEFFKEAIVKNPMFVKSYNALGEIYENMGDVASAIKYYQGAFEISPANTERLLALSKLFYKTGEKDRAETILKDAVSYMREDIAESAHLMGEMYLARNESEKALEMLKKAYHQNPSDISIMESLAEAYRKGGQPQQALELYKDCLKIAPDNAIIYYNMSKTHLEMADKINAIETMKTAWRLNPHSKEITADLKALAEKERLNL
ncbi:MAG: tetratricopeptide repeat protein [Dissulfurispiraceae bacterium]|jgi:two-component system chemotaxis response regulator CheY